MTLLPPAATPAAGRWLWFAGEDRGSGALAPGGKLRGVIAGEDRGSGALAPGGKLRGVIAGIADVPPFAVGVPITLRAALDARDPTEIGRGFTVESLAGVEIPAELRKLLQWVAVGQKESADPILVPSGARIALREE